jgi:hypothetical protein
MTERSLHIDGGSFRLAGSKDNAETPSALSFAERRVYLGGSRTATARDGGVHPW